MSFEKSRPIGDQPNTLFVNHLNLNGHEEVPTTNLMEGSKTMEGDNVDGSTQYPLAQWDSCNVTAASRSTPSNNKPPSSRWLFRPPAKSRHSLRQE